MVVVENTHLRTACIKAVAPTAFSRLLRRASDFAFLVELLAGLPDAILRRLKPLSLYLQMAGSLGLSTTDLCVKAVS